MAGVLFVVSPAQGVTRAHGSLIGNFTENLRYIRADEVFARTIITALLHSTLAMGFVHVLPVFAKDLLHVDARGLGILASAAGVGALIGFGSHAWFQQFLSWRNLLLGSLVVYNLTLIVLAFSTWYWVSFAAIFVSGICHGYFLTCAQVMLQTMVDDNYRGRVMGVFTGVESDVFERFSAQRRGRVGGPALCAGGRGNGHAGLFVAVTGARGGNEEGRAHAQAEVSTKDLVTMPTTLLKRGHHE
jgi:predicted MFS family arabinose efflux permease